MKNVQYFLVLFISLLLLNSCSKDEDQAQPCPQTEKITVKINGEEKQFQIQGWGIDLDSDGSGHTLFLMIVNGVFSPVQDSYSITLKLPYKKTGENIIEELRYFRVQSSSSQIVEFVTENVQSKVNVNTNTCISLSFSASAVIEGNEIIISEGIITHVYDDAFDN